MYTVSGLCWEMHQQSSGTLLDDHHSLQYDPALNSDHIGDRSFGFCREIGLSSEDRNVLELYIYKKINN